MNPARRRKTPETQIAKEIRKYARGYAAKGQQEHADGMLQAADLVDDLSARRVAPSIVAPDPAFGQAWSELSAQFKGSDPLEARVSALEQVVGIGRVSTGKANNGKAKTIPLRRMPAILSPSAGPVSLSKGELRILKAAAERDVTSDELTAVVQYRATSLRVYLGNLRAAGFLTTERGRHYVTEEGAARAALGAQEIVRFGPELFAWWMAGQLSTGEEKLLQRIAEAPGPIEAADLIGETTGLKATSVRTYLNKLSARKLITRPERGKIAIAPILTERHNQKG